MMRMVSRPSSVRSTSVSSRGALAELATGIEADSLKPFAEPGACIGHLTGARSGLLGTPANVPYDHPDSKEERPP
jgi:hypothetical protein